MLKSNMSLLGTVFVAISLCFAQEKPVVKQAPIKQSNPASGKEMYNQYCAPCHGMDEKGNGPTAPAMKIPPSDLTLLAKRHDGKYPADYVAGVLKFGNGPSSHGSADMRFGDLCSGRLTDFMMPLFSNASATW
jgi:mono/diheme cytochrome c family protein